MNTLSARCNTSTHIRCSKLSVKTAALPKGVHQHHAHAVEPTSASDGNVTIDNTVGNLNRRVLFSASLAALLSGSALSAAPAKAGGPVGQAAVAWWTGRQKANRAKITAPIKAAQAKLAVAREALDRGSDVAALRTALTQVRAGSLNCYIFEALPEDTIETKASLLTQQWAISDPCTFRLIIKNITQLSDPATQQEGQEILESLLLSFQVGH